MGFYETSQASKWSNIMMSVFNNDVLIPDLAIISVAY